jgi:hypothetical protein
VYHSLMFAVPTVFLYHHPCGLAKSYPSLLALYPMYTAELDMLRGNDITIS